MKKSILIFGTLAVGLSLMAFSFLNRNKPEVVSPGDTTKPAPLYEYNLTDLIAPIKNADLVYKVGSRYLQTISKVDLHAAKSITDILPEKEFESKGFYRNATISVFKNDVKTTELAEDAVLTEAQIKLLQSTDYSSNVQVSALYEYERPEGRNRSYDAVMHFLSITPSREAEFAEGYDALINYLRENSKDHTAHIHKQQLKGGQFSFTVTKEGKLEQVEMKSTSGYEEVDQVLINLLKELPGKWKPAMDANGHKIDQEMTFFFGLEGC
ncbi:MAG: hypothetical protein HRU41_01645 [Saprospiraceae bacterium]|nr:hypothetical protein [Saprospiraceae bacterium]